MHIIYFTAKTKMILYIDLVNFVSTLLYRLQKLTESFSLMCYITSKSYLDICNLTIRNLDVILDKIGRGGSRVE